MPTLASFESEDEIIAFVKCKVESILAQQAEAAAQDTVEGGDSSDYKAAVHRFKRLFQMPEEEKLVNCKIENVSISSMSVSNATFRLLVQLLENANAATRMALSKRQSHVFPFVSFGQRN